MAEGTTGVKSAGGAEKATAARVEALEPGAHGGAGSRCERVSERSIGQEESDWARGTHEWGLQGETCHDAEKRAPE